MIALLNIFSVLYDEPIGFLGIGPLIEMYKSGDYSSLHTLHGHLRSQFQIKSLKENELRGRDEKIELFNIL